MEALTSLKNPKVQLWRSLKDAKGRRETGLFLVEGRKMTAEALVSGFEMEALLMQDDFTPDFSVPAGIPVYSLPAHVLAAVCDTKTPQGVAAILRMRQSGETGSRVIVLDGVQDPGNVGTILRTADAAGFTGALLSDRCADVFSPKVIRATMGSLFRMPVRVTADLPEALRSLRGEGFDILSSELGGARFYDRAPVGERFCLIIGNEGNGVSPEVSAEATQRLRLPMRGGAESLNAAIAAGVMMYELTKQLPE